MFRSTVKLLAITELGGYPDFTELYQRLGYEVIKTNSIRKAVKLIRKHEPRVIVSEFNFQSDFRDRTSSLETVISSAEGIVEADFIVFYEKEYKHQYDRFLDQYNVFSSLVFPIDETMLEIELGRVIRAV